MTPILILFFGTQATTAVGTDLLYAAITKSAGSVVHARRDTVDWIILRRLALGSVPATILTIATLYLMGVRGNSSPRFITIALGLTLILSAAAIVARPWIVRRHLIQLDPRHVQRLTTGAGFLLGVLVTVTSVAAGALGMTMLVILYPTTRVARLVGTDIAHAVPLTLIAGLGHWLLGSIDWGLMALLLVGSVPGIIAGSYASGRIPEWILRPILAAILVIVGFRML